MYDIEKLERDVLKLVQDNLSDVLTEIEVEKADGIELTAPVSEDYFTVDDFSTKVVNRKLLMLYGVTSAEIQGWAEGNVNAEELTVIFAVLIQDQNATSGILRKKLFRYTRALKTVFERFGDNLTYTSSIKVESSIPQNFQLNGQSPIYKLAGVYLTISIT